MKRQGHKDDKLAAVFARWKPGARPQVLAVALLLASPNAPAADWGTTALLERLARPAPATIGYTEVRFSNLLTEPLVVSGELAYLGPGVLERRVEHPFQETTTIRGEDVTVKREGEPQQRFSLKRAPELRSMLEAFGALLAGNRTMLEQSFSYRLEGDESRWHIDLVPRDAKVRRKLESVTVNGAQDQPQCLALIEPDGDADFLQLGDSAAASLPASPDRVSLEARCREGR